MDLDDALTSSAKINTHLRDAEKYRQVAVAEGEAEATRNVYHAIHDGDPSPDLVAIKYLEALRVIANGRPPRSSSPPS